MFFHRKRNAGLYNEEALLRFQQSYDHTVAAADGSAFLTGVREQYKPTRRFRRNPDMWQATLTREATVLSCLLEFGEKITGKSHFVDELQTSLAQSKKDKKHNNKWKKVV